MKAVILAAGQGKRLRPLTDDRPKCLVPFKGKPILHHILKTLNRCDIQTIAIVKGYAADTLQTFPGVSFYNARFEETNMAYSFFLSRSFWDDDLIVSYADIVYDVSVLKPLVEESSPLSVSVDLKWRDLWEKRGLDPIWDAETLKMDPKNFIVEIGKKPKKPQDVQGQYIGLIKIKKEILGAMRDFYDSLNRKEFYDGQTFDNMYMTSFLQLIIDQWMPIKAVPVRGGWVEIDSLKDLEGYS